MSSPMGLRGVICERFGWTLQYLENEIPWMDVHTMMIDAPHFEPDTPGTEGATPETPAKPADKLAGLFNKYQE